jgi:hypothetical protein
VEFFGGNLENSFYIARRAPDQDKGSSGDGRGSVLHVTDMTNFSVHEMRPILAISLGSITNGERFLGNVSPYLP